MSPVLAVFAAIGSSLFTGISTVQQKIGADKEDNVRTLDATILWKLLKNRPYLMGTGLEILGYGLSLVALRVLPLFLVQSIVAASVVITAIGERILLRHSISRQTTISIAAVLVGLVLLGISAEPTTAKVGSHTVHLLLELSPLLLGIMGIVFIYIRRPLSALLLSATAGLAFGNTSTIGRIIVYPHPFWKIIELPLFWGLIISGILGQYLFTLALQRASATKNNAVMIAMQTLGPALLGLVFFGDKIRSGYQLVLLFGAILVITGCITTAIQKK